jgi:F-box protein 18 (helicase)
MPVRNVFLSGFKHWEEFMDFAVEVKDIYPELMNFVKLIERYGSSLASYLEKARELETNRKEEAQIIFTTTHKAKGLEYNNIQLADDFLDVRNVRNEYTANVKKLGHEGAKKETLEKYGEEINILYVALTRTRNGISGKTYLNTKDFVNSLFLEIEISETLTEVLERKDEKKKSRRRMTNRKVIF